MTVEVRQGQTATLDLELRNRAGALADADAGTLALTLAELDGTVVDGFPVAQAALTHVGTGLYRYLWSVPIDQEAGTLLAEWNGFVAGEQIGTATEDVFVLPAEVPSTLSVSEFRAAFTTSVDDATVAMLIEAAAAEITAQRGPVSGPITERRAGGGRVILLRRPAASITSVSEISGFVSTPLASTSYLLRPSGMSLLRLPSGFLWGESVETVYVPVDDSAERKRIQLALVKLDLTYSALTSQRVGEYAESQAPADYVASRRALLTSFSDLPLVP